MADGALRYHTSLSVGYVGYRGELPLWPAANIKGAYSLETLPFKM